jgi:ferredoxin, 2Fe-2S
VLVIDPGDGLRPKVTYVHPDNARQELEVEVGMSVMQAAVANDIEGIVAECGGSAMCATCHVYLDESDLARAPEMRPEEDEMLEFTASPRRETSRLSCQLVMTAELNGIVVYLPEDQR